MKTRLFLISLLLAFIPPISSHYLGKFELHHNTGWPRHNITSDRIDLLDSRRIKISGLQGTAWGPFALWSARLRTANHNIVPPLDQLGVYRDNYMVILSDPSGTCQRPLKTTEKRDIILTLPKEYTWNDVAWLGLYCYGYEYVFNYVWISHYENGQERLLPPLRNGIIDLVTDTPTCTRKLRACTNNSVSELDVNGDFCYRRCEVVPELFPELDIGFHCGYKLREQGKLNGCRGLKAEDLYEGESLPSPKCFQKQTPQYRSSIPVKPRQRQFAYTPNQAYYERRRMFYAY